MVSDPGDHDLLEIREPAGAFERLESYLRAAGFFGADAQADQGRCADLYLGYGLSAALRRIADAGPPEPAALPLAACRIRSAAIADDPAPRGPWRVGEWQTTWSAAGYAAAVRQAREAIAAGEVYQVNLVQHLHAPVNGELATVAAGLAGAFAPFRPLHGRPFIGAGWAIVSASPELFLARRGRHVRTMPIKGTRPRGSGAELRSSAKDAAEHVMIVDLERNDLGVICMPGSVRWPELMRVRPMVGVEHLVSSVEGTLREDVGLARALAAMFPGGSVTGAPKVAAIDHIARLEPVGRGAAMGAMGTVWPNGDFELALTIRTFAISEGHLHLWVGGGVVWDSDPDSEVEESWTKARPLLDALERASREATAA